MASEQMNRRFQAFSIAAVVCLLGMFFGAESAPAQDTIYWCKHDNGAVYGQKDPCAPGMEVRTSKATNGLSEGQEVQSAAPTAVEAPKSAPEVVAAEPAATTADNKDALKQGQLAWLRYLGWALVFGVIAKLFKKSFFLGFFLGFILRIVLVSADLVKF